MMKVASSGHESHPLPRGGAIEFAFGGRPTEMLHPREEFRVILNLPYLVDGLGRQLSEYA
jgi:hypothetical protein